MDYKSNSSCSSPGKPDKSTLERMDRSERQHPAFGAPVPVLPVRNNLRAPHFTPAGRFHFRKGLSSRCSWKCTAIVFILLFVLILAIASYMSGKYSCTYINSYVIFYMKREVPCTIYFMKLHFGTNNCNYN